MADERLRELERRYRQTGAADDELDYLRELARGPGRWRVELAGRFGSPTAARAIDQPPGSPDSILFLSARETWPELFSESWEAAQVYLRAALGAVFMAWKARGPYYEETLNELRPMLVASDRWFASRDPLDAKENEAWANSANAWTSLIHGRFRREGRALSHVAWALGCFCRLSDLEEHERLRFVLEATHLEVLESIKGLMYMDHPGLNMTDADYGDRIEASIRPFEVLAARAVVEWALRAS